MAIAPRLWAYDSPSEVKWQALSRAWLAQIVVSGRPEVWVGAAGGKSGVAGERRCGEISSAGLTEFGRQGASLEREDY